MTKVYIAVARIERRNEEGELVAFNPEEALVGFDDAELKRLVDAGAIIERNVGEEAPKPVEEPQPAGTEAPSAQDAVYAAKAKQSREDMEKRATELGVNFTARLSDEKLAERISEAELTA